MTDEELRAKERAARDDLVAGQAYVRALERVGDPRAFPEKMRLARRGHEESLDEVARAIGWSTPDGGGARRARCAGIRRVSSTVTNDLREMRILGASADAVVVGDGRGLVALTSALDVQWFTGAFDFLGSATQGRDLFVTQLVGRELLVASGAQLAVTDVFSRKLLRSRTLPEESVAFSACGDRGVALLEGGWVAGIDLGAELGKQLWKRRRGKLAKRALVSLVGAIVGVDSSLLKARHEKLTRDQGQSRELIEDEVWGWDPKEETIADDDLVARDLDEGRVAWVERTPRKIDFRPDKRRVPHYGFVVLAHDEAGAVVELLSWHTDEDATEHPLLGARELDREGRVRWHRPYMAPRPLVALSRELAVFLYRERIWRVPTDLLAIDRATGATRWEIAGLGALSQPLNEGGAIAVTDDVVFTAVGKTEHETLVEGRELSTGAKLFDATLPGKPLSLVPIPGTLLVSTSSVLARLT